MYHRPGGGGDFGWKFGCPMFVGCVVLSIVLSIVFYATLAAAIATVLCWAGNFPWC